MTSKTCSFDNLTEFEKDIVSYRIPGLSTTYPTLFQARKLLKVQTQENVSLFAQIEYFCCQIIRGRFQMNYNFKMDKDHPLFQGLVENTKDKRLKIYPIFG
jgi:hypothetical protein